jgi:hypothetical protein
MTFLPHRRILDIRAARLIAADGLTGDDVHPVEGIDDGNQRDQRAGSREA